MAVVKLNREQQRSRKLLESAFDDSLKQSAKALGWSYLKPSPFRRIGDWFVYLDPSIHRDEARASLGACVKPFAIDDLVSRILGFDGLEGKPLSLRSRGPHILVRPMFATSVERDGDLEAMLAASLEFIDETTSRVRSLTIDDFIRFSSGDRPPGMIGTNQVAALILADRLDEALGLCEAALAAGQAGGPSRMTEDGRIVGFFTLARRWIVERRTLRPDVQ